MQNGPTFSYKTPVNTTAFFGPLVVVLVGFHCTYYGVHYFAKFLDFLHVSGPDLSRVDLSIELPAFLHNSLPTYMYIPLYTASLLAGSRVGLKSKRFVFEILLARENRGAKRISKTNLFDFNPTGEPASRLLYRMPSNFPTYQPQDFFKREQFARAEILN